ncbi:MAG: AAA family ATPase [Thermodesulfobacteriota bacterium]
MSSATEQEIWSGALNLPKEARNRVFCFVRSIVGSGPIGSDDIFIDQDEGQVDEKANSRLKDLKRRLRQALPRENLCEYKVFRKDGGITNDHLGLVTEHLVQRGRPNLCQDVYDALAGIIREEIMRDEKADPLETEIARHAEFARELAEPQYFTGRAKILTQLAGFLAASQQKPIAVIGASGSGKSTLMAYVAEQARHAYPAATVITRFIGATPDSANIRLLLESLCRQMAGDDDSKTNERFVDYHELFVQFRRRLKESTGSYQNY